MSPRSGERLQLYAEEGGDEFVLSSADGQLSVRLRLSLQREALDQRADSPRVLIDWSQSTIGCGRSRVALSRTELRLLAALLEDDGKPVTRAAIIGRVWPGSALSTAERHNALAVYVCTLRKRLSTVGLGSALQTVRGIGYRFAL
jgi:DNA-binding response OmpR family regulator